MAYIMDIPSPQEIGKNIQKHRRAQKITQKEFAKRLGKSERTIQKYESGEIIMKLDVVKEVANELNIPFQELLYPAGIDNAAKEPIKQTLKTNIRSEVLHEEKYLFESTRTITSPRFRKNTQTLCNQKEIHPIRPYRQLLSP